MNSKLLVCLFAMVCVAYASTVPDRKPVEVQILNSDGGYRDTVCPCPRIYDPVCGNDLHVYNNFCMFECARQSAAKLGLKLLMNHRGSCRSVDADEVADAVDGL